MTTLFAIVCFVSQAQMYPEIWTVIDTVKAMIGRRDMTTAETTLLLNEEKFSDGRERLEYDIQMGIIYQYKYEMNPTLHNWKGLELHLNRILDFFFDDIQEKEALGANYWNVAEYLSMYYYRRMDKGIEDLCSRCDKAYELSDKTRSSASYRIVLQNTYGYLTDSGQWGPSIAVAHKLLNSLLAYNDNQELLAKAFKMYGDSHLQTGLANPESKIDWKGIAKEQYENSELAYSKIPGFKQLLSYVDLQKSKRALWSSESLVDSLAYFERIAGSSHADKESLRSAASFFLRHAPLDATSCLLSIIHYAEKARESFQYDEAEAFMTKAIGIIETKSGEPAHTALLLEKLADLYYQHGSYENALEAAERARGYLANPENGGVLYLEEECTRIKCLRNLRKDGLVEAVHGLKADVLSFDGDVKNSPMFLSILNHLAGFLHDIGETEDSDALRDSVIVMTANNPKLQDIHSNAVFTKAAGEYNKGHYRKVIGLLDPIIEMEDDITYNEPGYYIYVKSLILTDDPRSTDIVDRWIRKSQDVIEVAYTLTGTQGRDVFWGIKSREIMELSLLNASRHPTSDAMKTAYENVLYARNLKLQAYRELVAGILEEGDDGDREAYRRFLELGDSIKQCKDDSIRKGLRVKQENIYNVIAFRWAMEGKLSLKRENALRTIHGALKKKEAAIEFVYVPLDNRRYVYGAMILKGGSDGPPVLVELCPTDTLAGLLNGNAPGAIYDDERLYELVWEKIEKELKGYDKVFYSTIGHMNFINLDAIFHKRKRIGDRYGLTRLSSTLLVPKLSGTGEYGNATLYGGLRYDDVEEETAYGKEDAIRAGIRFLGASETEVTVIDSLLKERSIPSQCFKGYSGSERAFRELSGRSTDILHLATHGFYLSSKEARQKHGIMEERDDNQFSDIPLSYSGILLSGAKAVWENNHDSRSENDGILTAEEISSLDLSNTDLVVLSACSSGLGELDTVEGTMGLVRGFKMAGAKTMLMSLWEVDDDATSEFMISFYNNLLNGKTHWDAYRRTLDEMRKRWKKPKDWAGFILLD